MMIIIYITLIGLSFLGGLVLILDIIPNLTPKIIKKIRPIKIINNIDNEFNNIILEKGIEMLRSNKPIMIWEDRQKNFTNNLLSLRNKKDRKGKYTTHNFPTAFLLLGVLSYILKVDDKNKFQDFIDFFDKYIDKKGKSKFEINIIDHSTFGIISLKLYNELKDEKYLVFADNIYEFINSQIDPETSIIDYRKNSKNVFVDTIGLALPFLIEYGRAVKNESIINLVKSQLQYYINYGIDPNTYIPSHGVNKQFKTKVGSANWGRGIGWFFLGLSYYNQYYKDFEKEYNGLYNTILNLKNDENLWSQFLGIKSVFDASTTTIFLYSIILNNPKYSNTNNILNQLKNYLTVDGCILQTSGDTYYFNEYATTFGKSELSQGFLLLVLSELYEKNEKK